MNNKIKLLLIATILFFSSTAYSFELHKFDDTDKALFATVIISQIADGLTTNNWIEQGGYIKNTWNWKYGTDRPSPGKLWGIKAAELLGVYYIGKILPSKARKVFYIITASTLIYCVQGNLRMGAGFSIGF